MIRMVSIVLLLCFATAAQESDQPASSKTGLIEKVPDELRVRFIMRALDDPTFNPEALVFPISAADLLPATDNALDIGQPWENIDLTITLLGIEIAPITTLNESRQEVPGSALLATLRVDFKTPARKDILRRTGFFPDYNWAHLHTSGDAFTKVPTYIYRAPTHDLPLLTHNIPLEVDTIKGIVPFTVEAIAKDHPTFVPTSTLEIDLTRFYSAGRVRFKFPTPSPDRNL